MILRLFLALGLILSGVAVYSIVIDQPPAYQMPPSISQFVYDQTAGLLPASSLITENEEVEHGIFEVPPRDEDELKAALETAASMPGMDMNTMKMGDEGHGKDVMEMDDAEKTQGTSMTSPDTSMNMGGDMQAPSEVMTQSGGDAQVEGAPKGEMPMQGAQRMAMAEGGLRITEDGAFDREITLIMREWGFSNMKLDVKMGERIKFTVRNGGKIPHEFMFMTMPAMTAVNYRAQRADWSLLEHEALFEKSLVLPESGFSFVVEVQRPGAWMFMCMLPYHMQMGMMGQMATEGMAMQM